MNSYELSRIFFNYCFENTGKIKPRHHALYFFAIEQCNRLGWKKRFGLPTEIAREVTGILSYNTYIKTLLELEEFGFIFIAERSKNQFTSNIIELSKNDKAQYKALDNSLVKHKTTHCCSTVQLTDSINKQVTIKQINNKTIKGDFEKINNEEIFINSENEENKNEKNKDEMLENNHIKFKNFQDEKWLSELKRNLENCSIKISLENLKIEADIFVSERLIATDTNKNFYEYADWFRNIIRAKAKANKLNTNSSNEDIQAEDVFESANEFKEMIEKLKNK